MSDDTSLDEAMAAARSDDEHEQTAHQLDAFHATFNFCMTCRQYTCGNCWNDAEGRCLTCAPHLGHEVMPAPFPELPTESQVRIEAWPEMDLRPEAGATAEVAEEVAEIDATERLDRLGAPQDRVDAVPSWLAAAEAEALAAAEAQAVIEAVSEPLEQSTAFEAAAIAEPVTPAELIAETPEPVAAVEPGPEPAATVEPSPEVVVAAASEPPKAAEPEPVVAAEPAPVIEVAPKVAPEVIAAAAILDAEPIPAEEPDKDRAIAAKGATAALFAKFRPGQNIDAELAAYEASVADEEAAEPVIEPETVIKATAAAAMAHEATEGEPVAAAVAPEAVEPVAAGREQVAAEAGPAAVLAEPPVVEPEPVAAVPEPEPVAAQAAAPAAAVAQPEPVAAVGEPAAVEPAVVEPAVVEPAVVEPAVVEPEPVAAPPEPEPVAAQAPAAAEPLGVEPEPPAAAAAGEAPDAPRTDVVEQPTWQIVAPDTPAPVTNGHAPEALPAAATAVPPPPPAPAGQPQWPSTPEWPQPTVAHLSQRGSSSSSAIDALWAASVRDVVAPSQTGTAAAGGVQPCNNCGLSLSANARFCRRCGTRQG
jgi:hypothetical protein